MTTVTPKTTPTTAPAPRLTTASRVGPLVAFLARRTFVPLAVSVLIVVAFLAVLVGIPAALGWSVSQTPSQDSGDGTILRLGIDADQGHVHWHGLPWLVPFTAAWGATTVTAGLPRLVLALVGLGATRRSVGIALLTVVAGLFLTVPVLTVVSALLVDGAGWTGSFTVALPATGWLLAALLAVLDLGLLGLRRGTSLAAALSIVGFVVVAVIALLSTFGAWGPWALGAVLAALTCGFVALMARLPVE